MKRRRSSPRRAGAMATGVLLAMTMAAGCDEDDEAQASQRGTGGQVVTSEPAQEPSEPEATEPAPEPTPAETPTTQPTPTMLTGAACLLGNWYVDNQQFGELMSSVSGSAVDDVTGVVMVTFRDDGTTTTHYDDWKHTITVQSATVTIIKNGEDHGTYEMVDDGTMTLTDTDMNSTTTAKMEMQGRTTDYDAPPQPSVFSQSVFTCEGDELTVTAEGATTVLHREH